MGQLTEIPTLAGIGIPVLVSSDGTAILDARAVMVRDIRATNGIVHVIDAVLLPE